MLNLDEPLPAPSDRRVAVHITNDALRQLRGGHPWIWDRSITSASPAGRPGDLAVIFDDRRKFAAIGLWDPDAAISVRVLHHGSPRTIDDAFFADRLLSAFARREPLHDDSTTTAYRLVHGENDGLGGLVVDRYEASIVVKLDTAAWVPHLATLLPMIVDLTDAERVVLRTSRSVAPSLPPVLRGSPTLIGGPPPGPIRFLEHGRIFEADIERGQKTGHFLDQRENRQLIASQCRDASVLDVFCNSGGFSVFAAAGGARSVHSIDVSRHAIEATRRHMDLNRNHFGFDTTHTWAAQDAFEAMEDLGRRHQRFDVVIVDPPSFAPNAGAIDAARRAYRRLTAQAIELLAGGGTLMQASCSSRITADDFYRLVIDEIEGTGNHATNTIRTGHALDHPIGFAHGAYLKALTTQIRPAES